jgi:tetraacyldisaccharide 4'-kinase
VLLPLTFLYCALHYFQRWKLTRRQLKIPVPVIVVGNISIGGTGKTPTVIYLANLLKNAGYKPAVITRGYGGKSAKWPRQVTGLSDPLDVGDEAVLIAKRTALPVVAGPDRYVDIQYLLSKHDCNIIISDDGLQHYHLHRDIEIALIDADRELGNGWCLPAGPLRENSCRLKGVDFVVYNNGFKQNTPRIRLFSQKYQLNSVVVMALSGGLLSPLSIKQGTRHLADLKQQTVHAVTGISHPERFFHSLENEGLRLIKHSFPDHYNFTPEDLAFNDNKIIIMTEKDAVKCRNFGLENCWYLAIEAKIEDKFSQVLLDKLRKNNG